MEKYIKDGMVAVLYSPGYGAGWYSWNESQGTQFLFDPEIAKAVEAKDYSQAEAIAKQKYPHAYLGGLEDLEIKWVPEGVDFTIQEYDGSETVEIISQIQGIRA